MKLHQLMGFTPGKESEPVATGFKKLDDFDRRIAYWKDMYDCGTARNGKDLVFRVIAAQYRNDTEGAHGFFDTGVFRDGDCEKIEALPDWCFR